MRIKAADCQPNSAHKILAKWEHHNRFHEFLVATQNIDGFHHKAGSAKVSEIHGSLWQMVEPRSADFSEDEQFSDDVRFMAYPEMRDEILQRWSEENRQVIWENRDVPFAQIPPYKNLQVRPNILLYDESYGSRLVWVDDFMQRGVDVVLVIGCSGGVTILNQLLRQCREVMPSCEIININPFDDFIQIPHIHLPMPATEAMERLNHEMS